MLISTRTAFSSSLKHALKAASLPKYPANASLLVLATPHYPASQLESLVPSLASMTNTPIEKICATIIDRLDASSSQNETSSGRAGISITALNGAAWIYLPGTENGGGKFATGIKRVGRVFDASHDSQVMPGIGGFTNKTLTAPLAPPVSSPGHSNIKSIFTISDDESYKAFANIDHMFPNANTIGLIASKTPFITGAPFTIYHADQTYKSGLVYLASHLVGPDIKPTLNSGELQIPRFTAAAGSISRMTNTRGNIILTLDGGSAIKELMSMIVGKDQCVYARVSSSPLPLPAGTGIIDAGVAGELYRVIGGDPGKGAVALDCVYDLCVGDYVQFGFLDIPSAGVDQKGQAEGLNFFTLGQNDDAGYIDSSESASTTSQDIPPQIVQGSLNAYSIGGIVYKRNGKTCSTSVPGCLIRSE